MQEGRNKVLKDHIEELKLDPNKSSVGMPEYVKVEIKKQNIEFILRYLTLMAYLFGLVLIFTGIGNILGNIFKDSFFIIFQLLILAVGLGFAYIGVMVILDIRFW